MSLEAAIQAHTEALKENTLVLKENNDLLRQAADVRSRVLVQVEESTATKPRARKTKEEPEAAPAPAPTPEPAAPESEPQSEAKSYTLDEVKAAAVDYLDMNEKDTPPWAERKEKLTALMAARPFQAAKTADLKPEHYGLFMDELAKLVAEKEAAAASDDDI